jgi:hypothetical protein
MSHLIRLFGGARALAALALAVVATLAVALEPSRAIAGTVGIGSAGMNITTGLQGRIISTNALGSVGMDVTATTLLQLTGGTGAGQVDTIFVAQRTIAASGTDALDLNGSLTDAFGNSVAFLHVKAILIVAASGNTNDVTVAPGASNPFNGPFAGTTPSVAVSPGETFLITKGSASATGWAVTAATGDILKIANSGAGTSVTYNIYILGTST